MEADTARAERSVGTYLRVTPKVAPEAAEQTGTFALRAEMQGAMRDAPLYHTAAVRAFLRRNGSNDVRDDKTRAAVTEAGGKANGNRRGVVEVVEVLPAEPQSTKKPILPMTPKAKASIRCAGDDILSTVRTAHRTP
jgi:hypothetical protein